MPNEIQIYGDLKRWNDKSSGARRHVEFHHPKAQGDMRPLGSFAYPQYEDQNGKRASLLVGNAADSSKTPAVASPIGYKMMWDVADSGSKYRGSLWRPLPPNGYVSLGDISVGHYDTPSTDEVWCVRAGLAVDADYDPASLWDGGDSGARMRVSVWGIAPPAPNPSGSDKIAALDDMFRVSSEYTPPSMDLAKVLALPCPKNFTKFNATAPTCNKKNLPRGGDKFSELKQCEVVLPFTVFFPSTDRACLQQISRPFCRLARTTAWYVHATHSNNSGGEISDKTTVTRGVSKTESTEMAHSAGVKISASYGISGFGMGVSLNYQFTSTTTSSYNEYTESSREQGFTVPPYHATVFLVRHVWLKATRSDGTAVLRETGFNANDDIHLIGVKLR
ncbi:duf946 domain-containing protein [Stemphylium lycopersici]|uniref:Duf946 domain-containing protein n=1 Tax=Stemphylium lycopersici TaxID=183478 RepID=A0A364MWT2_STELY|nr:duf946 domain-containing protein [Stemphylium lycopersici]RAR01041.1 duf946 domain-containing protein [Stemphylium lycopersici]RAR05884.1 duf946 domain-containing protein [Stemphylium lycopersici]